MICNVQSDPATCEELRAFTSTVSLRQKLLTALFEINYPLF